jgi:hypothetical protein
MTIEGCVMKKISIDRIISGLAVIGWTSCLAEPKPRILVYTREILENDAPP